MTRKLILVGALLALSALIAACGNVAIPEYEQDETSVAVARTSTRESLLTQGAIIPTNTPTITPSPTVDFEATAVAEQATLDAQATVTAEFEATAAAEAQAAADAQATVDAQATIDANPETLLANAVADADPANGELLFVNNSVAACTACHNVNNEEMLVGPGQLNVFARTVERIEDGTIDAEGPYSYLYNSIVHPNDYITEGFTAGIMPATYGEGLTEDEILDIVAYLVTLED